jgi:hypothetical protein
MDEMKYNLELAGIAQNIALGELEEARAKVRTKELAYEMCRFQIAVLEQQAREMQERKGEKTCPTENAEMSEALKTPPKTQRIVRG